MKRVFSILLVLAICVSMSSCSMIEELKISSMSDKELLREIALAFQDDNFEEALKYTERLSDETLKGYYKEYINCEIAFASFNGTSKELYYQLKYFFEIAENGEKSASGYGDDVYLIWDWHKEQKEGFETNYVWIESAFEWLPESIKIKNNFAQEYREVLTDSMNLLDGVPNYRNMIEIPYYAVINNTQRLEALKEKTLLEAEELFQVYTDTMAQDEYERIKSYVESASEIYYEDYAYDGITPEVPYEIDYNKARNRYSKSDILINMSVNSGALSGAFYEIGIKQGGDYYYCGIEGYDDASLPTYLLATFLCNAIDIPMDNVVVHDFFDYEP